MFSGLLALHMVIYHGVALDYDFYPILFFCFILLFITSCCTDFYSFVICSTLLSTSSLTCPCPSSHSWIWYIQLHTWYFYHACWAHFPLLLFCFRLPHINLILSILPPTLLIWVFSCVSLPHRLEFFDHTASLSSYTTTLPSIQSLATTLLADTILLRHFHCTHFSLHIHCTEATGFLLDSLTLGWDW
jgi:hypothetical protein